VASHSDESMAPKERAADCDSSGLMAHNCARCHFDWTRDSQARPNRSKNPPPPSGLSCKSAAAQHPPQFKCVLGTNCWLWASRCSMYQLPRMTRMPSFEDTSRSLARYRVYKLLQFPLFPLKAINCSHLSLTSSSHSNLGTPKGSGEDQLQP
jgi:hypothetical protein